MSIHLVTCLGKGAERWYPEDFFHTKSVGHWGGANCFSRKFSGGKLANNLSTVEKIEVIYNK